MGNCFEKSHDIISVSWPDELGKIFGINFSLIVLPANLKKKPPFFHAHKILSIPVMHPENVVTIALGN